MKLDRSLIKSQARELIKGKVFKLFIVIFIVMFLVECGVIIDTGFTTYNRLVNTEWNPPISDFGDVYDDSFDEDGNFDFGEDTFENYFEEYTMPSAQNTSITISTNLLFIVNLIFMPLMVTLAGLFLLFIKGEDKTIGKGLSYIFKTAFDKNYFNRFLLMLLQSIFAFLWSLLFIIPGFVYAYKVYFTAYIMAENPDLSWKEAINLSKKMTNGHKGELFVLDLSFIPWYLLVSITLCLAGIYVAPYIETTKALYYENFKQRALQSGELSELDFMTEAQKAAAFNAQNNYYGAPQQNYYQPPYEQNTNTYERYQAPQAPQASAYPETPQSYEPPVYENPYDNSDK